MVRLGQDLVGKSGQSQKKQHTDSKDWIDQSHRINSRSPNGGKLIPFGNFPKGNHSRNQNRHGNCQNHHVRQIGENELGNDRER